jgi:hypothetical protein
MRNFSFLITLALLLTCSLLFNGCAASTNRYKGGHPVTKLAKPSNEPIICHEKVTENTGPSGDRVYLDYVMQTENAGEIIFRVSLPPTIQEGGLPTALIMSGVGVGKESLDYIKDHGNYVLIALDYPKKFDQAGPLSVMMNLKQVRRELLSIPAQVNTVHKWAKTQSWCNKVDLSYIGLSLGAIVGPAVLNLGQSEGVKYGPTVFAYGGAGLNDIFYANGWGPGFVRKPAANVVANAFDPISPEHHLPNLHGEFLLIAGKCDYTIPWKSAEKFQQMTPEPKTIINLESGHVSLEDRVLLDQVIKISRSWVEEKRGDIAEGSKLPAAEGYRTYTF